DRALGEIGDPRLGFRQQHAFMAARGPPAHHGVGHVGMKLQRKGGAVITEGLHRKRVSLRQQFGAERQVEALAMPLIDLLRPGIAHHAADIGGPDRVIADLGVAIGMAVGATAEMMRQHLGAEADAEKRLLLLERHGEPIDLATDESVVSFALMGPPNVMAPAWPTMVSGSGSPKRGRRTSSG